MLLVSGGGGNRGSTTSLRAFSIIDGISLSRNGEDVSIKGFVLTSIRYRLNWESSMKSRPKISNEFKRRFGSILL